MTLGRTSDNKIKIKTDGEAGLRAVSCGCCGPVDGVCSYHYRASWAYLEHSNDLPCEIYLGGTRVISNGTWGGVIGGMLLSRNGTNYGDTTNGVILENQDGYPAIWAIYKNSVRSISQDLIDGVRTHDTLASSYIVSSGYEKADDDGNYNGACEFSLSWGVTRLGCDIWAAPGWEQESKLWAVYNNQCGDVDGFLSSPECWPSEYPYQNFSVSPREERSLDWNGGWWQISPVYFGGAIIEENGWFAFLSSSEDQNFKDEPGICGSPQGKYNGCDYAVT